MRICSQQSRPGRRRRWRRTASGPQSAIPAADRHHVLLGDAELDVAVGMSCANRLRPLEYCRSAEPATTGWPSATSPIKASDR